MRARFAVVSALLVLVLAAPVAHANEQTPSVKDPLASVRVQLTHYDLEPQGTLALLPQLAALMQSAKGTPEAAEAAFLRAAAANDLLYLAEFLGRDALKAGLAAEFAVAPDALAPAIAAELRACAQGVYREPAIAALAVLERKEPPGRAPVGSSDLRRDARFVHAAAALAKNDTASASGADQAREKASALGNHTAPASARRDTSDAIPRDAAPRDAQPEPAAASPATSAALPRDAAPRDAQLKPAAASPVTDAALPRDAWSAFFTAPLVADETFPYRDGWSATFATSWSTPEAFPRRDARPMSFAASLATGDALAQRNASTAPQPVALTANQTLATHDPLTENRTLATHDPLAANQTLAPQTPSSASQPPALLVNELVGGRFAALIDDPCKPNACPAPYADFDVEARRAYAYLQQLSAASVRLERSKGLGDPLFEVLAPVLEQDIATLRTLVLRLAPKVPGDRRLLTPTSLPAWPAPHAIVFARATELVYARTQQVRIGTQGEVERVDYPAPVASAPEAAPPIPPVFPATQSIKYDPNDTTFATRSIDELVAAIRTIRGDEPEFRAWLVADAGITAQMPARALVSLRKAGAKELFFAATTKDGTLVASPVRLVIATVDSATENPDLKLRVRLGGYTLDLGRGVTDIPRVRDESGWQFDVAALHSHVRSRPPRTAAVSFMTDVAVDQLLRAVQEVAPSRAPIDLVIQ